MARKTQVHDDQQDPTDQRVDELAEAFIAMTGNEPSDAFEGELVAEEEEIPNPDSDELDDEGEEAPKLSHYARYKAAHLKYQESEKGKLARAKYAASDKAKVNRKAYRQKLSAEIKEALQLKRKADLDLPTR